MGLVDDNEECDYFHGYNCFSFRYKHATVVNQQIAGKRLSPESGSAPNTRYSALFLRMVKMKKSLRQTLFWAPRILGILFAIFISVFALDVFDEGYGFWETMLALAMHLIPTALLVTVLIFSWRWDWIGGILFPVLGILYLLTMRGLHWSAYAIIGGPLFLEGVLFLLSWRAKAVPPSAS
jgi:hypothetical protein